MPRNKELNIVFLPPTDIAYRATSVSRLLRTHGALLVLGRRRIIPHVTIYASVFPQKNVAAVKKALTKMVRGIKPVRLDGTGYKDGERGYILCTYKKTKSLKQLQKNIITILNTLRENNIRPKDKKNFKKLPPAQRTNLIRYGSRYVETTYSPHLTISKVKGQTKTALKLLPKTNLSFTTSRIALCNSGKNGTCGTVIASWNLKKNK